MEREMRKIVLTLGAAVVALTALQATDAQAGGKKHFHSKHYKPYWHSYYGHRYHYGRKCFWKRKKVYGHYGWYWKRYRVCVPRYKRHYYY